MSVKVVEALEIIEKSVQSVSTITLPILESVGLVSAQSIKVNYPLPRFNNSAMDGYGVMKNDAGKCVKIIEEIFAGDDKDATIHEGECIKITTGARVPSSIEAIIPQEDTQMCDSGVKLPEQIKGNSHIRFIGEDIDLGETVIEPNTLITSAHVALLASQGISYIKTKRPVRVAVFATGEELKLHYEKIEPHQIYNSNAPHLFARVKELGCEVDFIGQTGDSLESIEEIIKNAVGHDLIITSGGVSVGEKDFTSEAFSNLGLVQEFCKIDIKPGKPTVFGKIEDTYVLNLPGNPLAAALIFEMFGTNIIKKLQGDDNAHHNFIFAKLKGELKQKAGRATIIPGAFDGEYFTPSEKRAPGMVSVLKDCNSYIITSDETSVLNSDQSVKVLPINWSFYTANYRDIFTS